LIMFHQPMFYITFWLPSMNRNQISISKSLILFTLIIWFILINCNENKIMKLYI
jgi:hypothetical protein